MKIFLFSIASFVLASSLTAQIPNHIPKGYKLETVPLPQGLSPFSVSATSQMAQ